MESINNKLVNNYVNILTDLACTLRSMSNSCCKDISLEEYTALKSISLNKDCCAKEINLPMNMTKGGISKLLKKLLNKGFIIKIKSKSDQRIYFLKLTELGKEVLNNNNKSLEKSIKSIMYESEFSNHEYNLDFMQKLLLKIKQSI